jgi:hypothetical protein
VVLAGQRTFGEEIVGRDRARRGGPGVDDTQRGERRPRRGPRVGHVAGHRTEHHRLVRGELGHERVGLLRHSEPAEDDDEQAGVDAGHAVQRRASGDVVHAGQSGRGVPVGGSAHHGQHTAAAAPAERGGLAGRCRFGRLGAADQPVDDQRLEARVPSAAALGGAGVDPGGGEGDLPGKPQHRLAHDAGLLGQRQAGHPFFHDVHHQAHHLDGLAQRHRPGQFRGSGAEYVGGQLHGVGGRPQPLDETGDAGLRHKRDPAALVGGQGPEPRQGVVHLGHALGGQGAGRLLDAADRLVGHLDPNGHGVSLPRIPARRFRA